MPKKPYKNKGVPVKGSEVRVARNIRLSDSAWSGLDEVAKTLNSRYLNPHEEDNQQMITFLGQQKQGLEKAAVELVKAQDYALKADSYSQQVSHFLAIERQEVKQAYHSYNLSL